MRNAKVVLTVLALSAAPLLAVGQEFPPPEVAARLAEGGGERIVQFPIGVTYLLSAPSGSIVTDETKLGDVFSGIKVLQFDAGIRFGIFGPHFLYRKGTADAEDAWCPSGRCTATFDSIGFGLGAAPPAAAGDRFRFSIAVGYELPDARVEDDVTGAYAQLKGWGLYEKADFQFLLGDSTSPFSLGICFMWHIMSFDQIERTGGVVEKIPIERQGDPMLWELGLRLAFD